MATDDINSGGDRAERISIPCPMLDHTDLTDIRNSRVSYGRRGIRLSWQQANLREELDRERDHQ